MAGLNPGRSRAEVSSSRRHVEDADGSSGRVTKRRRTERREATWSEDLLSLREMGVDKIPLDDPSVQASIYKRWLKRDKGFHVDELSRSDQEKYYRRFARRWNDGALPERYYRSSRRSSRSASPSRSRSTRPLAATLSRRSPSPDEVGPSLPPTHLRSQNPPARDAIIGPSAPSHADILLAREDASNLSRHLYKQSLRTSYAHANDLVPKSLGKEGKLEEKRATSAANKAFADKDAEREAVVDESTLMGAGGGFADAIRKRDAAKFKREQEREMQIREKREGDRERLEERKRKEEGTMAMFREMAKNRFG